MVQNSTDSTKVTNSWLTQTNPASMQNVIGKRQNRLRYLSSKAAVQADLAKVRVLEPTEHIWSLHLVPVLMATMHADCIALNKH